MNDLAVWVVWGVAFCFGVAAGLLASAIHHRREADTVEEWKCARRAMAPRVLR